MLRQRVIALIAVGLVLAAFVAEARPAMARNVSEAPSPRCCVGMAYDAAKGEVVLFGGSLGPLGRRTSGETWTWDGASWSKRSPIHSPPRRSDAELAYDDAHGSVVLFGGRDRAHYYDDTWTWDGSDWTEEFPAHHPDARADTSMAYDAADGDVVMFGGDLRRLFRDTWTWDGSDWTKQSPVHSPSRRKGPDMAYDAARTNVALFGGQDGGGYLGDTWTWDGADWTKRTPAHSPDPRWLSAMTYDVSRTDVVLFGGQNGGPFLGDTWTWNGTDWTLQSPVHAPEGRLACGVAFDESRAETVVFGGFGSLEGYEGSTWTWDGADWTHHAAPGLMFEAGRHSGPPGSEVELGGWGFSSGGHVKLLFVDSRVGRIRMSHYVASPEGSFHTGVISIPEHVTQGKQHIEAVDRASGKVTKIDFTVT
jgi:hypothetical protein